MHTGDISRTYISIFKLVGFKKKHSKERNIKLSCQSNNILQNSCLQSYMHLGFVHQHILPRIKKQNKQNAEPFHWPKISAYVSLSKTNQRKEKRE